MDSCHCIFELSQFSKMMLGSSVVYYGDEIGMTGFLNDLSKNDTRDPYVSVNCAPDDDDCYLLKSRDPMRTPMQVCNNPLILITLSSTI